MTWVFDDKLPIYLQIIQILKADIARGKYQTGEKLPAVRELALTAGVNPNTMQKALAELERDGLVKSQRTSGRFVTDDKEKIMEVRRTLAYDEIERMVETISSLGYQKDDILRLLEKYLADARANLEELKSETSAIIADEMAAARRVAANNEEIAKYDRYAEQAVLAGNDDDARKFLDAKSQLVAKKAELEAAYETAKSNSDKMRQMTRKLMEDIASAEGKMVELRAKLTVAEHKEKMDDLMHKVAGRTDMSGFENMMEAVQKRIDSVDAKVALNEELADKMDIKKLEEKYSEKAAEVSASVEADLAALKARLGK